MPPSPDSQDSVESGRMVALRAGALFGLGVLLAIGLGLAVWQLAPLVLLLFGGVLLAIAIDTPARFLEDTIGLPRPIGLVLATVVILGGFAVAVALVGPVLVGQIPELGRAVETGVSTLESRIAGIFGLQHVPTPGRMIDADRLMSAVEGLLAGAARALGPTLGAIGSVVLVVAFAIYLAASPATYLAGTLMLVPKPWRPFVRDTAREVVTVLRWWLVSVLISMIVIGTVSYVALMILGVPLALSLAVFAGLVAFLPYIGPILGATPMVLVALSDSTTLALWVLGFYVVLQTIESYLIAPLVQARAVALAPVVVIGAQVALGTLLGFAGLALATPLCAAGAVILRRLNSLQDAG